MRSNSGVGVTKQHKFPFLRQPANLPFAITPPVTDFLLRSQAMRGMESDKGATNVGGMHTDTEEVGPGNGNCTLLRRNAHAFRSEPKSAAFLPIHGRGSEL